MDTLQILMGYTSVDISTGRIPCLGYDKINNRDRFIDILFKNTSKHYSPSNIGVTCIGSDYSYFNIMNSSYLSSLDIYKKGYIPFGDEDILTIVRSAIKSINDNKRVISYLFVDLSCIDEDVLLEVLAIFNYASMNNQIRTVLTTKRDTMPRFKEHETYRDYYITETNNKLCVVTRDYWGELVRDIFE